MGSNQGGRGTEVIGTAVGQRGSSHCHHLHLRGEPQQVVHRDEPLVLVLVRPVDGRVCGQSAQVDQFSSHLSGGPAGRPLSGSLPPATAPVHDDDDDAASC
eukprot:scaffold18387_cov129-Isochrysis_galbana.AAC.1